MKTEVLQKRNANTTRLLLAGGVASAPLFYTAAISQVLTRTGFDIKRHAISSLTLGDLGWIQSANFIFTGLLAVLAALGIHLSLRGSKGATGGSWLIGIYGLGMIGAGLFRPDPGFGFPVGAPAGMPSSMSVHAALHSVAFFTAFICLVAASLVFARRFAAQGERGWRAYCLATGIISPLLIIVGMSVQGWTGVVMGCAGIVAFGWVSALAFRLRTEASL